MIDIHTDRAMQVPPFIAQQCIPLCHDDSESQSLFRRIAARELAPHERDFTVAYAWNHDHGAVTVIGWATLTTWLVGTELRPQVQCYVALAHRSRRIATALCVCLSDEVSKNTSPVCVFNGFVMSIAKLLGWNAAEYRAIEDGWIRVGDTGGQQDQSDAGVHAAAHTVCGLPLACGETGEDA